MDSAAKGDGLKGDDYIASNVLGEGERDGVGSKSRSVVAAENQLSIDLFDAYLRKRQGLDGNIVGKMSSIRYIAPAM